MEAQVKAKMVSPAGMPDPDQEDWEARGAAGDIQRAQGHLKNKPLMKRVKKHAAGEAKKANALSQMLSGSTPSMGGAFGQG